MYLPSNDTQNDPFIWLHLVVETFGHSTNEPTNQNSLKFPKLFSQRIRKQYPLPPSEEWYKKSATLELQKNRHTLMFKE